MRIISNTTLSLRAAAAARRGNLGSPRTLWLLAAIALAAAGTASAQTYPTKPIRIVTSAAGGSLDLTARTLAPKLSEALGQPVLIDNRGLIGMELVAKALPDGYTLILASGPLWLSQLVRDNVGWDVARDFAPITLLVSSPNVVAVHPSLPVRSIRELIALAKAKPGELNFSSGQTISVAWISGA